MNARSLIVSSFLVISLGVGAAASAAPRVNAVVEIGVAPPPPRAVAVPPPRRGYVWAPGYWRWNGRRHVWVAAHWMRERPGWHWEAPHWDDHGGRWHFEPGHWER